MKKILSVLLCLALILCAVPVTLASAETTELHFNENGEFKILVFADCQDTINPSSDMLDAMGLYLDLTEPDLVVLPGDNVVENTLSDFTTGLTKLLQPIISRGIPYAFTFGNHDDEYGVSKEEQYAVYKTLGTCLTVDEDPELTGLGTCNIPIYSSTGDDMAFNLWIVDSNTYDRTNGGYDNVHADQLEWMAQRQAEITAQEGKTVNSIVFQHIIVPEVADCLTEGSGWTYGGKTYALNFKDGMGSGTILEHPCPPTVNSGEYAAVEALGGVLGIVTGHDHTNDFIAKPGTVDLIQVGGMTYNSYGDDSVRGASLITLNENDTENYQIQRYINTALFAGDYGVPESGHAYYQTSEGTEYISELAIGYDESSYSAAMKQLTDEGFTVIPVDLNKSAGGDYIYLGYKTTTDVTQAVTSIRVTNSSGKDNATTKKFMGASYSLVSDTDLNRNAGGNFIYLYCTKDAKAGAPLTLLTVNETASTEGYTAVGSFNGNSASDLNKKAGGAYIYIQTGTTLNELDADGFIGAYETAVAIADGSNEALGTAVSDAKCVYDELTSTYRTAKSQAEIDELTEALMNALDGNGNSGTGITPEEDDVTEECTHLCHKTGFPGFIWKIVNLFNKLFKVNQYCSCGKAHW